MDWYKYEPRKWRADTRHLTPLQDGIYHRLVDEYMDTESPFPDDDAVLASVARMSLDDFAPHALIIRAFFHLKNGKLRHKKCDAVLHARIMRTNAKSESASNAAKIRWERQREKEQSEQQDNMQPHSERNADAMRNDARGQDRTGQESRKEEISTPVLPESNQSSIVAGAADSASFELVAPDAPVSPPPKASPRAMRLRPYLDREKVTNCPDEWGKWAMSEFFWQREKVISEWERFVDYWTAKAGKDAAKLDWKATWRNWCRNENERAIRR